MRTPRAALWAVVSLLGLASLARPQDAHYWTNQYGSRATLLGGAVIGSVLDLSGTYYNPGGLSLLDKSDTLMAAKVFQSPRVTLGGGGRESVPLNNFSPGPAPTLLAGSVRLRGLPKHWFGYSYLARQSVKLGVSASSVSLQDVLPDVPGDEHYVTQFRLDEKLAEHWFGLTWSTRLSKHVGLGVTQYIAYRSQRASTQKLAEALSQENHLAMAVGARQYSYHHFRALWKFGLACDFEGITLGLALTTPSLAIVGSGSTGVDSAVAGLDRNGDGTPDDLLAADYQDHLPMTYRTPLSLAAGMTFKIRKIRVYWSAEWFAPLGAYTVVDSADFIGQSTGGRLSSDVTHELAAVLNWGVGLEWSYSSRFKGYASFTTDDSAKRPGTSTNMSLTDWDIHHIVTGGEFKIKRSSVTVGLGFSFGGRAFVETPDLISWGGSDWPSDPFEDLRFRYITYKLIVGFAF